MSVRKKGKIIKLSFRLDHQTPSSMMNTPKTIKAGN